MAMRTSAAATARILCGLMALALLVVGGGTLCWHWHVAWVRDRIDHVDQAWFTRAPQASWWTWSLAGLAVVAAAAGIAALVALLRPNRIGDLTVPSTGSGRITLNINKIAQAAASELAADRRVRQATGRALNDGRREVLRITASIDALIAPSDLDELLRGVTARTRTALGPHPIHLEYLLHVDR